MHWLEKPTPATSDYFHSCNNNINGLVGVPKNNLGYQNAFNGDGYIGLLMASYTGGGGAGGYWGIMWWEYVQGHLTTNLTPGQVYKLSMEISISEFSGSKIKEFGAYFSPNPITGTTSECLNVTPQCTFTSPDYFGDTLNWMHVETYFIADGSEYYLTIGNFKNDITTDTAATGNVWGYNQWQSDKLISYYYIDDVQLVESTLPPPPPNPEPEPEPIVEVDVNQLLIPNIFTPNGDGANDLWFIYNGSNINNNNTVLIVNRWGEVIKSGNLIGFTWDGKTATGEDCTEGLYFYRIEGTKINGIIELVR